MAISAITLAELSAGPHEVRGNDEQDAYDERAERRPWKAMSAASASRLPPSMRAWFLASKRSSAAALASRVG
jgi:hypothetical protein